MNRKFFAAMIVLLLLPALLGGCVFTGFGRPALRGNGAVETRDVTPGSFTGISVGGGMDMVYRQGDDCGVEIETDANLFDRIRVTLRDDGILDVRWDGGLSPTRSIIYITAPTLRVIDCSGALEFRFDDPIEAEDLKLTVSGACDGTLKVEAASIEADISGATDMAIEGTCETIRLTLSGAGNVDAKSLTCKDANLRISGAGAMSITCEENLDASVSGAGSITYYGDPRVSQDISGAASIRKG